MLGWVERAKSIGQAAKRHGLFLAGAVALVALLLLIGWGVRLATAPERLATPALTLARVGLPNVQVQIIYPAHLTAGVPPSPAPITIMAQALDRNSISELSLTLAPKNESVAFVDQSGKHIPGRVRLSPGYPDAMPADLLVVHGGLRTTRGTGGHKVDVMPMVWLNGEPVELPELRLTLSLERSGTAVFRRFIRVFSTILAPLLGLIGLIGFSGWGWRQILRRRGLRREQALARLYLMLREQIKLEQWGEAREAIEQLRLAQSHYRDTDQLEALVSAAETAGWRREQLYRAGIEAYKRRDWPNAVQAFRTIENETPYYRDVRFLRRTAALCADLASRDRSLRIAAAQKLGEVADLMDMTPLLDALGDESAAVAEAATHAFEQIGLGCFDALLQGLVHPLLSVRRRAYGLLQGFGQDVRERLLNALHSESPGITVPVARLLANLAARDELAQALLWAQPVHHPGIVRALCTEGLGGGAVLVQMLLQALEGKEQVIIDALAALKMVENVDRRLEEALRGTRDGEEKARLRRALEAPAAEFNLGAAGRAPSPAVDEEVAVAERRATPRLRLLGGGSS